MAASFGQRLRKGAGGADLPPHQRKVTEQCKYQVPRNETNGSIESVPQSHSRYRTRHHHGTDQRTPERTRNANLAAGLRHRTGKATDFRRNHARKSHTLSEQSYMRKRAGYKRKEGSREYLIRDIVLYNDKIIINYYFAEPLKKHTNSIASVIETEKQSREAASLSEIQSSYKGDNSPPMGIAF